MGAARISRIKCRFAAVAVCEWVKPNGFSGRWQVDEGYLHSTLPFAFHFKFVH